MTEQQSDNSPRHGAEHLVPHHFKPGVSPNPGGRPKGRSITTILRDLREETKLTGVKVPDGKTLGLLLAERIFRWALEGDAKFAQMVLDRTDGQVKPAALDTTADAKPPRLIIPDTDPRNARS